MRNVLLGVLFLGLVNLANAGDPVPGAVAGKASFYTTKSCQSEGTSGVWTASGEKFDESALTCALRRRDWGSTFKVTNTANGKTVTVRLNDFGPGKGPTAKGVVIDLTPAAWKLLGATAKQGIVNVLVEPVSTVTKQPGRPSNKSDTKPAFATAGIVKRNETLKTMPPTL